MLEGCKLAGLEGIIVTVGTTPFDSLIRALDSEALELPIHFQIGNGSYLPSSGPWFRFKRNLFEHYRTKRWLVVTHAGAGSIYSLLESGAVPLALPNFERIDNHQKELATYIEHNTFGKVCWNTVDIGAAVESYLKEDPASFRSYERKSVGLPDDLLDAILGVDLEP